MSNLESNAAAKAIRPSIVIKHRGHGIHGDCGVCHQCQETKAGPTLFLEGQDKTVCYECGRKYAPHLVAAIETLQKAEWQAEQERQRHKQSLLTNYSGRNPKQFVQLDGWWDADDVMGRDENGQGATGSLTWELMHGSDVRVLIPLTTTKDQALVLLRKIVDWVGRDGVKEMFPDMVGVHPDFSEVDRSGIPF